MLFFGKYDKLTNLEALQLLAVHLVNSRNIWCDYSENHDLHLLNAFTTTSQRRNWNHSCQKSNYEQLRDYQ